MFSRLSESSIKSAIRQLSVPPYLTEAWVVIFFALVAIVVNYKMIRDGVIFESYDLKFHLIWLQLFSQQLSEGILYPRWLAGDNYGYGSPTFVFYPPLVYYLGSLLKISGLNAEQTILMLFYLAVFCLGLSCYIYGRSHWGKLTAFIVALFYMSAPYLGFNLYLRGALAETWSLIWIPLAIWITERAISQPKWRVILALITTVIALTHVPSLLICTIFLLLYTISFLFNHAWKDVFYTIGSIFLGFGIASFYLLPAILEKSLVNINNMSSDELNKLNLLSFGFAETTSIVRKYVQPIFLYNCFVILIFASLIFWLLHQNILLTNRAKKWLFILLGLALLMIYPSLPIWESSKPLQMIQFPWRTLGLFSFGIALLSGIFIHGIFQNQRHLKLALLSIALVILLGNTLFIYKLSRSLPGFHQPGDIVTAQKKKTWKASIYEQVETALYDPYTNKVRGPVEYRPLLKDGTPAPGPIGQQPPVSVAQGNAKILLDRWDSYERKFDVEVKETSTIRMRTYYFPAWHLNVNNRPHWIDIADNGTIVTKLPPGSYRLELRYQWTPAFKVGTIASILSIFVLIWLGFQTSIAIHP